MHSFITSSTIPLLFSLGLPFNDAETRRFLTSHHWPLGLQDVIVQGLKRIPIRYFICDDSGETLNLKYLFTTIYFLILITIIQDQCWNLMEIS